MARITKNVGGSPSTIAETNRGPKNKIETGKLRALGMRFGGRPQLEQYVEQLTAAIK